MAFPTDDAGPRFFNRERELALLDSVWTRPGAQFLTLWGRRRVGKSALLTRFAVDKRVLYLYATRMTEHDLLASLAVQAAEALGQPYLRAAPFPNWDVALDHLARSARAERLLVVFDEFPYLCEATPGLDTLVQRWWDYNFSSMNLMLVIAGSAFSFMRDLTGVRGALHGRRTSQLDLQPFDYFEASQFFPHLDAVDRIRAYACFGGIPAYLRYWRESTDLVDMVQHTLLSPDHVLFHEGEQLLRTEFHQEALYASILRAVASGEERPSDIARAVGRHSADEIFDHLRRLLELRFLRREVPITEIEHVRSQRVLYRLADAYLCFWYRFVFPLQSLLQVRGAARVWTGEIAPHLDEFIGRTTWEEVVIQHLWRRLADDRATVSYNYLGRWWDGQDEIDIVGTLHGKATLVGECKWSATPVGEGVLLALQQKARKLPIEAPPLWVLASRSGFEPALRRRAEHGDVLLLTLDDLF